MSRRKVLVGRLGMHLRVKAIAIYFAQAAPNNHDREVHDRCFYTLYPSPTEFAISCNMAVLPLATTWAVEGAARVTIPNVSISGSALWDKSSVKEISLGRSPLSLLISFCPYYWAKIFCDSSIDNVSILTPLLLSS